MFSIATRIEKERKDSDIQDANRSARRENRTGIPTQLKERMEQSTGMSFDDVRVHYNSDLPARLDALAYTKGNQVEIGPGQECHLPHELGHVVQQKLGIVRANAKHSSGEMLNTEARLERQADEIGAGKKISVVQGRWRKKPEADVIQRATYIVYNDYRADDLQYTSTMPIVLHYQRVNMRQSEKDNAACYGDDGQLQIDTAGRICNHHAPYSLIENAIVNNFLLQSTVISAINRLNAAIKALNNVGSGYSRIPSVHFSKFDLGMTQEFDDAIANIANDPRNLFYSLRNRGDAGGTQLDWPTDRRGKNIAVGDVMFDYSYVLQQHDLI